MSKPKKNSDHMARVAEIGCLICQMPAEVHHCFTSMGWIVKSVDNELVAKVDGETVTWLDL